MSGQLKHIKLYCPHDNTPLTVIGANYQNRKGMVDGWNLLLQCSKCKEIRDGGWHQFENHPKLFGADLTDDQMCGRI